MIKDRVLNCLGYRLFKGDLNELEFIDKTIINTINQYSYCVAEKDKTFKEALKASDILLPDGVGITNAAQFLNGVRIKKIAGADLHEFLLKKLSKKGGSCFYLGASEDTLKRISSRIAEEYPNIKVGAYSPPFKASFSPEDNEQMLVAVNSFEPDVLFIGMTAPKQEKWSFRNKDELNAGLICAIGAVFDFYAGTVKRPGKIWRNLGLEWLGRLIQEPKRMWKRYLFNGLIYGGYLIKAKAKFITKGKA